MKNNTDRHHLYPRHMWGSNDWCNILRMSKNKHRALHSLTDMYGKAQAPREQILFLLSLNSKALTNEFKNDVKKILEIKEPEYFYKKWIIIPKYLKNGSQ